MFQKILVPTDGAPLSRQAEDAAKHFLRVCCKLYRLLEHQS
jgi:nucleotide-binding universal stress UspA family protein